MWIDRELEIGVPDKCGEFVPSLKEMRRLTPHAIDLERYFDPPRNLIVNRTKYVRFVFPNEKEINIEFEGVCTILMSYLLRGEPAIGVRVVPIFATEAPTYTILDLAWVLEGTDRKDLPEGFTFAK